MLYDALTCFTSVALVALIALLAVAVARLHVAVLSSWCRSVISGGQGGEMRLESGEASRGVKRNGAVEHR